MPRGRLGMRGGEDEGRRRRVNGRMGWTNWVGNNQMPWAITKCRGKADADTGRTAGALEGLVRGKEEQEVNEGPDGSKQMPAQHNGCPQA